MTTTAASRYAKLEAEDRRPFLDRARTCAKLTIPTLFPPEGSNNSTRYDTPYQGVGARGVNNLASKLLLTLFPPHSPHFKFEVDELTLEELTGSEGMEAEVSKALSAYTKRVMTDVEVRAFRPTVFEALKHLIVGGNGTLYVPEEGPSRFYQLEKYVCKRDPSGKLLELILKENIAIAAVPPELQSNLLYANRTRPTRRRPTRPSTSTPTFTSKTASTRSTRNWMAPPSQAPKGAFPQTVCPGWSSASTKSTARIMAVVIARNT
jgi:hypothetical protein